MIAVDCLPLPLLLRPRRALNRAKPVRSRLGISLCASSKRFAVKLIKTTETLERWCTHTSPVFAAAALLSHGPISLAPTRIHVSSDEFISLSLSISKSKRLMGIKCDMVGWSFPSILFSFSPAQQRITITVKIYLVSTQELLVFFDQLCTSQFL